MKHMLFAAAAVLTAAGSAAAQNPMNFSGLPAQRLQGSETVVEQVRFYCNWREDGEAQMALAESHVPQDVDGEYCYGYADIDRQLGDEIIRVNVNFFVCNEEGCPFEIMTYHQGRWYPALIQGPGFARIPAPRTFADSLTVEHRGRYYSVLRVGDRQRIVFDRVINTGQSAFEAR